MSHKKLFFTLVLSLGFVFNSFSQKLEYGQMLELLRHPTNDTLFIAKIYNSNKLLCETWELSTLEKGVKTTNYNDLLNKEIIFPNGKHIRYNDKLGIEMEENFLNGKREGIMMAFYPNGNMKLKCNYSNNQLNDEFISYYENGSKQLISNFRNGQKTGNESRYFENEKTHYLMSRDNKTNSMDIKFYFPDGKIKKKINLPDIESVFYIPAEIEIFQHNNNELVSDLNYSDGTDSIFTLISHLELPDNITANDTIYPVIVLTIDEKGKIEKIISEAVSDTSSTKFLVDWAKKLNRFSPPALDVYTWRSLFAVQMMFVNGKHVRNIKPKKVNFFSVNNNSYELEEINYYSYKNGYQLDPDGQIFFIVEKMPEFPGGEIALKKYIAENIKYPKEAQNHGIQGKVYITFIIDENGKVKDPIIRGCVHPLLDAEAIRVVSIMPDWKPGELKGKSVKVSFTVPINFILR